METKSLSRRCYAQPLRGRASPPATSSRKLEEHCSLSRLHLARLLGRQTQPGPQVRLALGHLGSSTRTRQDEVRQCEKAASTARRRTPVRGEESRLSRCQSPEAVDGMLSH